MVLDFILVIKIIYTPFLDNHYSKIYNGTTDDGQIYVILQEK